MVFGITFLTKYMTGTEIPPDIKKLDATGN
jgi:hypothetical protein